VIRDRVTGETAPVDFGPFTLEGILRSSARQHRIVLGHLRESLTQAFVTLKPNFRPLLPDHQTPIVLDPWPVDSPHWVSRWRRFAERREDARHDGQGLVEYALILSLIVIVSIVVLVFLGQTISTIFSNVAESI
jgi:pilus assembly protein Flp/PilA